MYIFCVCLCMCVWYEGCICEWACCSVRVEIRGQLVGIDSSLLLFGSWELNPGHRAWWQVPLPISPSCQPRRLSTFKHLLSSLPCRLLEPLGDGVWLSEVGCQRVRIWREWLMPGSRHQFCSGSLVLWRDSATCFCCHKLHYASPPWRTETLWDHEPKHTIPSLSCLSQVCWSQQCTNNQYRFDLLGNGMQNVKREMISSHCWVADTIV